MKLGCLLPQQGREPGKKIKVPYMVPADLKAGKSSSNSLREGRLSRHSSARAPGQRHAHYEAGFMHKDSVIKSELDSVKNQWAQEHIQVVASDALSCSLGDVDCGLKLGSTQSGS